MLDRSPSRLGTGTHLWVGRYPQAGTHPSATERRWSFSLPRDSELQVISTDELSTLGYWLAGHSTEQLCDRLGCDADTAMRLHRCGTPCVSRWWTDVEAIADWLRLDSLRLGALLIETEAASVAKTYAVTRGIVGVVSGFGR